MNLVETDQLLTVIQNITGRKEPADDAMVIIWQEILADLDYADCVKAVAAHFRESTDYLLPAHIVAGVRAIRNARAEQQHSAPLAQPSRFELDEVRDARIRERLPALMAGWSVNTGEKPSDVHSVALERAHRERRASGRAAPARPARREPKAIDLAKVTELPDWAKPEARERHANEALHRAGRACGQRVCPREQCQAARAGAEPS